MWKLHCKVKLSNRYIFIWYIYFLNFCYKKLLLQYGQVLLVENHCKMQVEQKVCRQSSLKTLVPTWISFRQTAHWFPITLICDARASNCLNCSILSGDRPLWTSTHSKSNPLTMNTSSGRSPWAASDSMNLWWRHPSFVAPRLFVLLPVC